MLTASAIAEGMRAWVGVCPHIAASNEWMGTVREAGRLAGWQAGAARSRKADEAELCLVKSPVRLVLSQW